MGTRMQEIDQSIEKEALKKEEISRCPVRLMDRLMPKIFIEVKSTLKASGFRGLIQRFGWKLILGFFVYYLVRDSIIYLLIPYLVTRGILG